MPIEVKWLNDEKHILYYTYTGLWSWQEFAEVNAHGREMMQSVTHRVDGIADVRQSRFFLDAAFPFAKRQALATPENFRVTVVVTANPAVRVFLKILDTYVQVRGTERSFYTVTTVLSLIFRAMVEIAILSLPSIYKGYLAVLITPEFAAEVATHQ